MPSKPKGLLRSEEKEVVKMYNRLNADGTRKYTQEEIASNFFVAPVTIRRALAEQGVITLASYKTRNETAMIQALNSFAIYDVKTLREALQELEALDKVLNKHEIETAKELDWVLDGCQP